MPTTIRTALVITGAFDPDAITRALGLTPTRVARVGDSRGGAPLLRHTEDQWVLVVVDHLAMHIDAELDALLSILEPVATSFGSTLRSLHASGQIAFTVRVAEQQIPSISIEPRQIVSLANLGLSLDIDII